MDEQEQIAIETTGQRPTAGPPFQFSLATLLAFVTGVCVAFSLVACHATFGLMAAIVIVGAGWSLAAVRAGRYRLAYTLATPAMGAIGHLVLGGLMVFFMHKDAWEIWFNPYAVLLMSAATPCTAMTLRNQILTAGAKASWGTAIGAVYLTSEFFPILFAVGATGFELLRMHRGPGAMGLGDAGGICCAGLIFGPIIATLTLPLTLPVSIFYCKILRKLDPWRPVPRPEYNLPIPRAFRKS